MIVRRLDAALNRVNLHQQSWKIHLAKLWSLRHQTMFNVLPTKARRSPNSFRLCVGLEGYFPSAPPRQSLQGPTVSNKIILVKLTTSAAIQHPLKHTTSRNCPKPRPSLSLGRSSSVRQKQKKRKKRSKSRWSTSHHSTCSNVGTPHLR